VKEELQKVVLLFHTLDGVEEVPPVVLMVLVRKEPSFV